MAVETTIKVIGTTGTFSTPQLWEDGAPADLTTAERSNCGTFAVATFVQGENLTFVGSGATGKMLDTDSTGIGTGTYMTYGITAGNPATADVITGATSTATCILTSGTPNFTGVIWQGQCQNQTFTTAGATLLISGSTPSSTSYKELTTVAGASFRDNANAQTNALRYNTSNGAAINTTGAGFIAIQATEDFFRLSKLQVASNTVALSGALDLAANDGCRIDYCIMEAFGSANPVKAAGTFTNCLIINRNTGATCIVGTTTASPSFYNCTIVEPDDLATACTEIFNSGASGTVTVQNCALFAGDSTKAIKAGSATFNFTTCYSDISGTAGVTQATYGNEFQNVNDATRDYRLVVGAKQIDAGTTDITNAATDIVGTTRPQKRAYDVSAWEFKSDLITAVLIGGGFDAIVYNVRTVGT